MYADSVPSPAISCDPFELIFVAHSPPHHHTSPRHTSLHPFLLLIIISLRLKRENKNTKDKGKVREASPVEALSILDLISPKLTLFLPSEYDRPRGRSRNQSNRKTRERLRSLLPPLSSPPSAPLPSSFHTPFRVPHAMPHQALKLELYTKEHPRSGKQHIMVWCGAVQTILVVHRETTKQTPTPYKPLPANGPSPRHLPLTINSVVVRLDLSYC